MRGLGCPVRIVLTAGQAGDAPRAHRLLDGQSAEAVIPSNPARARRLPLDKHLYKERHLVECCIGKLKQFRRLATRYEKTARNYLAVVTIAAIALWLR